MAEPDYIKVQHILVGFAGAPRLKCTRSKEEAKRLADTIFAEAKAGARMEDLMDKYGTDDSKPGIYGMSNTNAAPKSGYTKRTGMVPAFGNVGFPLKVGEVGMAEHDARNSPYGWHIIKRVE
jgi:parvulin-like peptidyl-prolyl isomerase